MLTVKQNGKLHTVAMDNSQEGQIIIIQQGV